MSAAKRNSRKALAKSTHDDPAARLAPRSEATDREGKPGIPLENDRPKFPIVGIGSSAGGLDAFKRLFSNMPAETGAAFVLVPHLDPKHESLMVELIGRYTKMPVIEAAEEMAIEPNHLYVLPPNKYMTISAGALRLTGPVERGGLQTSIDLFLRALAEDQQDQAICIILSGTGSHGTQGLVAIKAMGGMAMVQDPLTAEFASMPRSAIATGMVDHVLPVEKMPVALIKYLSHFYISGGDRIPESASDADQMNQVLALLRDRTKVDFRCYRQKVFKRRVERRMGIAHLEHLADYLSHLRANSDEVSQLARDLLISVTSFFRDEAGFLALEAEVVARLVAAADSDAVLRIWVPGCATGEEAYSIAILLIEQLTAAQKGCRVQIFATDADEKALELARVGRYPESIATDISPERLDRFFKRVDDSTYQINKQVRESVVFASQNLINDAPFSKMDLISCRNLLIYLEPEVQKKVVMLLHFALNYDGFLFLGPSETIGLQTDLFEPVSKKWRIYRRIGPTRSDRVEFPITRGVESFAQIRHRIEMNPARRPSFAELTQQLLLQELAPAAVLINRKNEVLYFIGPTTRYLHLPTGEPTLDLTMMAREGLRTKLRGAIHQAIESGQTVQLLDVQIKRNDGYVPIAVTIAPVLSAHVAEGLLLVRFEDALSTGSQVTAPVSHSSDSIVHQLEFELRAAKEDLQSNLEAMEGANEELQASNEEIMSMNEELQSANEELETSKEEMQSLNEELTTVNSQLQERVHDLEATNNDLANLLTSTDIATIFLDTRFRIKRFTASAADLLNLIASDVGRPFSNIHLTFADDTLLSSADRVLKSLTTMEAEVKADDQRWFIRRILPYRTLDNKVEGVVITFTNVTHAKEAEARIRELNEQLNRRITKSSAQLKESGRQLQQNVGELDRLTIDRREQAARMDAIVRTAADAIVTIDERGVIEVFNPAAERVFGYSSAEVIGQNVSMLMPAPYAQAHDGYIANYLATGVGKAIRTRRELVGLRKDGSSFPMDVAISEIREGRRGFTGFIRDVSDRKVIEREVLDAVTAEQQRIGQDLHDNTGQTLTGLGLMAANLVDSLSGDSPAAPIAVRIADGISLALGQIRAWSRGLMPIDLDSKGLKSALQRLAHQTNVLQGMTCDMLYDEKLPDLGNTTATHLFRIVQEALANAVRHSQAKNILIQARRSVDGALIVLSVSDDGRGLKPASDEETGIGLRIMAYRAHLIGATLVVEPGEDAGTVVVCRFPLKNRA